MTHADMREPEPGGRPDGVSADLVGAPAPLPVERLYRPADLSAMPFETTAEIEPIDGLVGQERAHAAIRFGARIEKPGFNLFVIGSSGARMQQAVEDRAAASGADQAAPRRLGLCQQFRGAAQADRDQPSRRSRRAVPRCDACADRRSEDGAACGVRKRGLSDAAGRRSIRRSRPNRARPFRRCATRPPGRTSQSCARPWALPWSRCATARSCRPTSSILGRKPNATPCRRPSGPWKRILSISCASSRNGRRSAATRSASSIAKRRCSRCRKSIDEAKAKFTDIAADRRASRRGARRSCRQCRDVCRKARGRGRRSRPSRGWAVRSTAMKSMSW